MKPSGNGNGQGSRSRGGGAAAFDVEDAVSERYARGARRVEKALCCPTSYDARYLKVIPKEILEKDYGCGDPTPTLKAGDRVLDLGCGAGKACFIASQIVGPKGHVIGVDFNAEMLALARKAQRAVGERIGWHNVEFRRGRIQDLATDLEALGADLAARPVASVEDYLGLEKAIGELRGVSPLVADNSVDVIISNCVLNLVRPQDKRRLFDEMHRVLARGGRVAISDIVSDEEVPDTLRRNPELWTGCISGAFQEKRFLEAFEEAGFYGIQIEKRDERPWRTVRGVEFRSVTVTATKGKQGPCWERNQAVIYKGPWKQVLDDDQHVLKRGVRTAVCDKTFQIFRRAPYRRDVVLVEPPKGVPLAGAKPFDCSRPAERDARETKGMRYRKTTAEGAPGLPGGPAAVPARGFMPRAGGGDAERSRPLTSRFLPVYNVVFGPLLFVLAYGVEIVTLWILGTGIVINVCISPGV